MGHFIRNLRLGIVRVHDYIMDNYGATIKNVVDDESRWKDMYEFTTFVSVLSLH